MAPKILFVDDETHILKSLKRLFIDEPYEIFTFDSPVDALEKLEEIDFAVAVSDQRMPEMTGAQFLEKAKKIKPDAIRFLLTGYSDLNAIIDAVNNGEIHRYLTKPWSDDELLLQIRQALKQYELVQENHRLTELIQKRNEELNELNRDLEKKVEERTREISLKNRALEKINIKLEKSFMDTIRLLSSLIETLNPELGKYMKAVAKLARRIAQDFGVEKKELETIEIAGLIHDIGLLGVPEQVWQKDEIEMNSTEFTMFSHHPVIASVCLESVEKLNAVGEIILYHHEHFDGSGFPAGLKGTDIPLGSRIIGPIADYYRIKASWPDSVSKIMKKAQKLIGPSFKNMTMTDQETLIPQINQKVLLSRASSMYDPEVISKLLSRLTCNENQGGKSCTMSQVVPVHFENLKVGMQLAMELRTRDGRFVSAQGSVLNKILIAGIKRLAQGNAIDENIHVTMKAKQQ